MISTIAARLRTLLPVTLTQTHKSALNAPRHALFHLHALHNGFTIVRMCGIE